MLESNGLDYLDKEKDTLVIADFEAITLPYLYSVSTARDGTKGRV